MKRSTCLERLDLNDCPRTKSPSSELIASGFEVLRTFFRYKIHQFENIEQWKSWRKENYTEFEGDIISNLAHRISANGIMSPWFGLCPPSTIECSSENYREALTAKGFNPRQRVVLDIIYSACAARVEGLVIYAPEFVTDFADELRRVFPKFIGSEYMPDQDRKLIGAIPHQDLTELTLDELSVDFVICNEIFEHVPNLTRALSEVNRVLKYGGSLIATFPFACESESSIVKAKINEDGEVIFFEEPEFHGNPIDPSGGSLVFQIPGWDLLEEMRQLGFSSARMVMFQSEECGVVSADMTGILALIAKK